MSDDPTLEQLRGRLGASEAASVLLEVLTRSAEYGLLGPGPVEPHVEHALGHCAAVLVARSQPRRILDLGSGGGVPGLVMAVLLPEVEFGLLDSQRRRCAVLRRAVEDLGIETRVAVLEGRAEDLARAPEHRRGFDVVTARSFGAPAVTAECAVGFLQDDGVLVVSEPPDPDPHRWPDEGLAHLGFRPARYATTTMSTATMELTGACEDRWPRRSGVPGRRPLWF